MNFHTLSRIVKYAKEYGHRRIRDTGVSDTEHKICSFLYFHSEVSQDTVAYALMMDKTTVAKALLSLEKKDCICRIRNPENRRKNMLSITDKGKETIGEVMDIYDNWLKSVLSCLTQEEQKQYFMYSERILEKAKQVSEENLNEQL